MSEHLTLPAALSPATPADHPSAASSLPVKARKVSVDVLRGVTVAFMILVNTAGDGRASYAQLRHSAWNGCTLTDLVFPTFLFLMGVSMTFTTSSSHTPKEARSRFLKATRRSATLILIGLVLNALPFFHLTTLRYCGVMQRIGITYWLAFVAILLFDSFGLMALCAVLLLGYWGLMTLVPVPGFNGNGLALGILNPMGNLASAFDRLVLPRQHLYHQSFYDPEGLLSTLPALASVLLGLFAGKLLRQQKPHSHLVRMAVTGASLTLIGLAWSPFFPVNKRMWTSSYVLLAAGIDFLLLALLSFYLDKPTQPNDQRPLLTPWLAFGSNALAAYVFSEVLAIAIGAIPISGGVSLQHYSFLLIPLWAGSPALRSLEWSLAFTFVCFLPVFALYRKKILIKL